MAIFPEQLETARLVLRRAEPTDAPEVFAYASDPLVAKYMTFPLAKVLDDIKPFLDGIQKAMGDQAEFHWAITTKEHRKLMGIVTARRVHGIELGYVLAQEHWGKGYMPEAALAVIDWSFNVEGAERVWATCDTDNTRSASVLKKLGMQEEGILRAWAVHPNMQAKARDARCFSMVRSS